MVEGPCWSFPKEWLRVVTAWDTRSGGCRFWQHGVPEEEGKGLGSNEY